MLESSGPKDPPAAPQMLDRYQLDGCIGRGGMAEVYRGKLLRMGGFEREVAVKILLPQLSGEPEFINMMMDEARIAATINHPNVVQVLDVGEEGQTFFLVMEFVDGIDLRSVERRHERGQVQIEPLLYIIAETLRGLEAIHNATDVKGRPRKIVHRDVTPSNILLTLSGTVKLGDFGIAHATGRLTQTRHGAVKGKTRYMAPEQLDGRGIDCRTDLFALGVVLLEALLGRDAAEAWQSTAMGPIFRIPARIPPAVPADISPILRRALQDLPSERYPSAAEFRRDVQRVLRQRARGLGEDMSYGPDELEAFLRQVVKRPELRPPPGHRRSEGGPGDEESSEPSRPSESLSDRPAPVLNGAGPGNPLALGHPLALPPTLAPSAPVLPAVHEGPRPELPFLSAESTFVPTETAAQPPLSSGALVLPPPGPGDGPSTLTSQANLLPAGPQTGTLPTLPIAARSPQLLGIAGLAGQMSNQATLPMNARLEDLLGVPDTKTAPSGPAELQPVRHEVLTPLGDEPAGAQVATTITRQHRPGPSPYDAETVPSASALMEEGSTGVARVPDLRRSAGLRRARDSLLRSTLVKTIQGTLVRDRHGNLPLKLLGMVGAGLVLAIIGLVVVYRVQGRRDLPPVVDRDPQALPPDTQAGQQGPGPSRPPPNGQLLITAPASTRVVIDGVRQQAAGRPYELSPGLHTIRLSPPHRREVLKTVEIRPGEQTRLTL